MRNTMKQLLEFKQQHNLTWKQIAEVLGKSESAVAAWGTGKSQPRDLTEEEILSQLNAAFGESTEDTHDVETSHDAQVAESKAMIIWNLVYAAVLSKGGSFRALGIRRIRFNDVEQEPYSVSELTQVKAVTGVDILDLVEKHF